MTFAAAAPIIASLAPTLLGMFGGGGGDKLKKISNFDKNQQNYFNQYTQQAQQNLGGQQDIMGLLQSMLDPNSDFFKNFENQQMNQFNEQTIPRLAEQFAGAGAEGGALSSSGFGQALGGAGAGLQSNLAQGKSGMIMQALQQLMQQYNQQTQNVLGAKPFDYLNQQKGGGLLNSFAAGSGNLPWNDIMGFAQSGFNGLKGNNLQNQAKGILG